MSTGIPKIFNWGSKIAEYVSSSGTQRRAHALLLATGVEWNDIYGQTFICTTSQKNIPCFASRYLLKDYNQQWPLLTESRFSIPTISHKTNPTKIFSRCWQWILSPLLLQREDSPLHSWRGIFTRSSNFKQAWQRNKVQTFYDRQKMVNDMQ